MVGNTESLGCQTEVADECRASVGCVNLPEIATGRDSVELTFIAASESIVGCVSAGDVLSRVGGIVDSTK